MRCATVLLLLLILQGCVSCLPQSTADGSCESRCGSSDTSLAGCQCSTSCTEEGTCCSDYESVCNSCSNRCTESNVPNTPCQCDSQCNDRLSCCPDYEQICKGFSTVGNVTDAEILALAEELYDLDGNNVANLIAIDMQGITNSSNTDDVAPNRLFTSVDESVFEIETVKLYEAVGDNFIIQDGVEEQSSPDELSEIEAFLNGIVDTPLMQRLEQFLTEKDLLDGKPLREKLLTLWFTEYSRSGEAIDSSGYEHVFAGEISGSIVGGFHNWITFYREEQKGNINYQGYIEYTDLQEAGYVLTSRFTWYNASKPIGGGLIGSSPEFEVAINTLCFLTRPNSQCTVQTNGVKYYIQTYDHNGMQVVGTAYPVVA